MVYIYISLYIIYIYAYKQRWYIFINYIIYYLEVQISFNMFMHSKRMVFISQFGQENATFRVISAYIK